MTEIGMVWAEAAGHAIGRDGSMPWHVPEDLAHFRRVTSGATVIMGRRTWESLPERFRPLPGRRNLVITRNQTFEAPGAEVVGSLDSAFEAVAADDAVWIMGGGELYRAAMPHATRLEITNIDLDVPDADTFAPEVGDDWHTRETSEWHESETGVRYRFSTYLRRRGMSATTPSRPPAQDKSGTLRE